MILSACFFLLGWVLAVVLTPWVIRICQRGIGLDDPNETRKTQAIPIPRLGGAPIVVAARVGVALIFWIDRKATVNWAPVLVGSVLMYGLGFWDDLKPLGARKKLLGQILIASLVWWMGLSIDKVSYPGARWSVQLEESSYFVTVFWLIAVPNIINLIDGFDGLAGGLGLVLATTLGIVAIHNEQLEVAYYAFTIAGALMGFLVYNFPPARIYLGDGGAYLIGFSIAALSLSSSNKGSVAAVLMVTIVALGIPILDTTFALIRRAVRGYPIFHADDEHFHHLLERLGLNKHRALMAFYAIAVVFSLLGLSIVWSQGRTLPIAIGAVFFLAVIALRYFHQVGTWKDFLRKTRRTLSRRDHVRYALLQAQVLELELERCQNGDEFWEVFELTLRRVGFTKEGEVESQVVVQVRYNGSIPWTLHAPRRRGSEREWQRLAECFRPVYARAKSKWQTN
jgi:UDP-GlcNAc:undecaprenyl-phosphate GlcNAc-1-phosphate transferase